MIITFCWVLFLLYWIANWRSVKPSQNNRNIGKLRRIYIVIVIMVLLNQFVFRNILHFPLCTRDYRGCHIIFDTLFRVPFVVRIIGDLLASTGVTIAILARHTLADNWSAVPELKKGHTLITSGIYSYIRHPIYTGMLCMSTGTLLVYPVLPVAIYCLVLLSIFLRRIVKEETLMAKTFPKDFPPYMKRTKRLIPFIY